MATTAWTLWQVLDGMPKMLPITQAKVEGLFGAKLAEKSRNEHMLFLAGQGTSTLSGGVTVGTIDLRLPTDPARPAFLVFDIAGACIGLGELRSRYANLELAEAPRGRSVHEVTTYSAGLEWGELSFSFRPANPDCVGQVIVAVK